MRTSCSFLRRLKHILGFVDKFYEDKFKWTCICIFVVDLEDKVNKFEEELCEN